MGITTEIAYCDSTLNLMMGCDGCELYRRGVEDNSCYAAALASRHAGRPGWPASFDTPQLFPDRLKAALRWPDLTGTTRAEKPWLNGYPRIIFVNDLGDTWTESLPVDWLAPHLPAMAASPHIWLFCTKRPKRAREFFRKHTAPKNLWLLTTVTGPESLGRIGELLEVPGIRVRGASFEPLRADVDIQAYVWREESRLDWIVAGFESGLRARPGHPQWARNLRLQATDAGVPFFWKQWGEYVPLDHASPEQIASYPDVEAFRDCPTYRVGKRAAGRLLDGREWSEMPEVRL